jgi:hypothetical protein
MSPATVRLGQLATARSGDKGDHANIGVVADSEQAFRFLDSALTAARVSEFFAALNPTDVHRFELPKVWAFNFAIYNVLAGGSSQSLRLDTQGKLLGTAILEMELPAPRDLQEILAMKED